MEVKLGDSSIDVVAKIARMHSGVQSYSLTRYSPSPGLQDRLRANETKEETSIFERAAGYRKTMGALLPYWESILIAAWESKSIEAFFREAIRHSSGGEREKKIVVSRSELTVEKLKAINLSKSEELALSSVCSLVDGTERFIPLMDFRVPPSKQNLNRIETIIDTLKTPGAILRSGKSYHFFGFELLSREQNIAFLGKCILLGPITDTRYIGHRLIEGSSDLRITASGVKSFLPIVESVVS